jgi:uracil-DNA glycosylase
MTGFLHAWQEWSRTKPSPRPRFGHGNAVALDSGVTLLTSYHPSQQNTFTGKLTRRMFRGVLRRARRLVDAPIPTS